MVVGRVLMDSKDDIKIRTTIHNIQQSSDFLGLESCHLFRGGYIYAAKHRSQLGVDGISRSAYPSLAVFPMQVTMQVIKSNKTGKTLLRFIP